MHTIEFARSFLTFRLDVVKKPPQTVTHKPPFTVNNARMQIDCHLQVFDKYSEYREQFVLGVNCKTERVGVDHDIWTSPNADFIPVLSAEQFMYIKTYDRVGRQVPLYPPAQGVQSDRQSGLVDAAFDAVRIELAQCDGEPLDTTDQIIEAALDNQMLVAVTEIESDRYRVVLQYPVKSINASERDKMFQTDTGPVLLPNLSCEPEEMIDGLELAFSAFNSAMWIEFLVRCPMPIADGVSVWHYSQSRRFDCKNRIVRVLQRVETHPPKQSVKAAPHFHGDRSPRLSGGRR